MNTPLKLALAAACAIGLGACASPGVPAAKAGGQHAEALTTHWRKITQVEDRFAVFINEPGAGPKGDLVTFKLAYIYKPGDVFWKENPDEEGPGKEVGWQEYTAMTINCATNQMKPGPRVRYAPDGKVMLSDDSEEFGEINVGTAADAAAHVRCNGDMAPEAFRVADGPKWMDVARHQLAEAPPPQ